MAAQPWTDHEARLAVGQACLDAALHLYLPLGLSVTCCCDPEHVAVGPQHGKTCTSPGKAPIHPWKHLQTTLPTADEVQQRWRHFPYGNVGCVLGQVSGLVRVDVDGPDGETLLAQWSAGDLPSTWTFRSSPDGRGLLYGWPRDLACKSTAQASPGDHQELRLMANGSQTVLPPSRHPSGRLYTWEPGHSPQDMQVAPAPPWLVDRLRHAPRPHPPRQTVSAHDAPDNDRVASALFAIPNDDAAYDDWLTIGMALHSTGEVWARGLWDDWSQQSGKYDAGKQAKSWDSFHANGLVTLGSLMHMAQAHGWSSPRTPWHSNGIRPQPGQAAQPALDALEAAQQAADALLHTLATTADDAREDAILDALPTLAPLDTIGWMRLKRQCKAAVPSLNLNDLERARNELRRAAAQAAGHTAGTSQAQIAAALAQHYAGTLAYDLSRQAWMAYGEGLWKPIEAERVGKHIMPFMDDALRGDYTWHDLAGVEHLLRTHLAQTLKLETPGWLPFRNGALHLATMTLHPHTSDRPFTWQLPHRYDPHATCPKTQAWLHATVGGAHDQVQVLRAYAKAILTRRIDLQRYLETLGPGGTGKGTYTRVLQALVGIKNTFATELKHLEANRFELSNLRGKALMIITDAERYSGPVNALKAITGQDFVRMEEKFKAPRTEMASVMVVVAANEPIQSADYTSGLVRRRLSMVFRHRPLTPRDLLSWKEGAWHGELAPEIPGMLNWVLALPDAQMEALLQKTTELVPSLHATWACSLVDTNPLAEWANQTLVLDDRTDTQGNPLATVNVGRAHKLDRTNAYEHQDTWLYPHYRAWVDDTGGKPLSSRRFTGLLNDLFAHQLQLEGVEHRDDNKGSRFCGIRFRLPSDADKPCLITTHAPPVTDGTDTVTAETRTSDGCDACDACLHGLFRHLPTPATSVPITQGGGVSIEECCNDPSNTSHPSLARGSGVTALSPPVTAPLTEEALAVGDGVWLCSPDRVQQHATPSHMMAITRWSKGEDYTLLTESPTGWLLARCERADPPRPSHGTHPPADTSGAARRNPLRQARRNECVEDRRARHSPPAALVPCAKCGAVDRWHDPAADLWRCCRCWPPGTSAMDGIEGER